MVHDVVRYHNGFNTVPLRKFTPVEMDIFWAVCSKMKRKGTQEMTFDFDVFKELANYGRREKESFYLALKATWGKMKSLSYKFEDEKYFEDLVLFQRFAIDKENEKVIIQASDRFEFILNSINSGFTRFELENMTHLSSSYTKEFYRHLMSFKDRQTCSGTWFVSIERFKQLLSIPDSYKMCDIDKQVFAQAKKEFTTCGTDGTVIFASFKIEKVKAKKGNRIASLRIYFEEPTPPKIPMYDWTK